MSGLLWGGHQNKPVDKRDTRLIGRVGQNGVDELPEGSYATATRDEVDL